METQPGLPEWAEKVMRDKRVWSLFTKHGQYVMPFPATSGKVYKFHVYRNFDDDDYLTVTVKLGNRVIGWDILHGGWKWIREDWQETAGRSALTTRAGRSMAD